MSPTTRTPEPFYAACTCHSGVGFYADATTLKADEPGHHSFRIIPAVQVAPEVRAEGRAWLAAR